MNASARIEDQPKEYKDLFLIKTKELHSTLQGVPWDIALDLLQASIVFTVLKAFPQDAMQAMTLVNDNMVINLVSALKDQNRGVC